ncbi:hsp7-like protein [Fonsecaea nubica]|uniref:Hsp7-like protein n=1 Tax=Fonsecaea nubica TaxID=856822 RepID=A0A178CSF0_9EURO|nr:hsp7-like protein [Fonsecaea nubica]OAL32769.1 hsp7-like protein [Fonsecaea nubica]
MADGKAASPPASPETLRPFRTKDDLGEDEMTEMTIFIDELILSCENIKKSKNIKRRYGSNDHKQLEEQLSKFDDFVNRLEDAAVQFVESLELEEVIGDDGAVFRPETRERYQSLAAAAGIQTFQHRAPEPEEAAALEQARKARVRTLDTNDSNRIRTTTMDPAPVPICNQSPSDAPDDKEKHYAGMLGEDWLKSIKKMSKREGDREAAALEDTGDPPVSDDDTTPRNASGEDGEDEEDEADDEDDEYAEDDEDDDEDLLRNPDATYVPVGGITKDD